MSSSDFIVMVISIIVMLLILLAATYGKLLHERAINELIQSESAISKGDVNNLIEHAFDPKRTYTVYDFSNTEGITCKEAKFLYFPDTKFTNVDRIMDSEGNVYDRRLYKIR